MAHRGRGIRAPTPSAAAIGRRCAIRALSHACTSASIQPTAVDGHFGTQNSERFVDHNIWGFRLSRRRSRAVSENVCGDAVRAASPA